MKTSTQGRKLIMEREGCVLKPYQDSVGVWTDGVGNTFGVVPHGPPISQEKADEDLERNLAWVEAEINALPCALEQFQYDALASFIFNVGAGAFRASTMRKYLALGNHEAAAYQFDRWHIPAEITSRRNAEREQFKGDAFEARIA